MLHCGMPSEEPSPHAPRALSGNHGREVHHPGWIMNDLALGWSRNRAGLLWGTPSGLQQGWSEPGANKNTPSFQNNAWTPAQGGFNHVALRRKSAPCWFQEGSGEESKLHTLIFPNRELFLFSWNIQQYLMPTVETIISINSSGNSVVLIWST